MAPERLFKDFSNTFYEGHISNKLRTHTSLVIMRSEMKVHSHIAALQTSGCRFRMNDSFHFIANIMMRYEQQQSSSTPLCRFVSALWHQSNDLRNEIHQRDQDILQLVEECSFRQDKNLTNVNKCLRFKRLVLLMRLFGPGDIMCHKHSLIQFSFFIQHI